MAAKRKPKAAEPNAEAEAMKLRERVQGIVHRLDGEVRDRIIKRKDLEDRWIEDLQQYHGKYDDKTAAALTKGDKSKLFINLTRPKADIMSAKLMDLLFPTDDRNWAIQPTPVPLLADDAAKAVKALREINDQLKKQQEAADAAAAAPQPGPDGAPAPEAAAPAAPDPKLIALQKAADFAKEKAKALQEIIDEASKRAEAMTNEIDDQLKASNYHAAMRDVIDDACKIGTGVCKGPVTGDQVRRGWKKTKPEDGEGAAIYQLDVAKAGTIPAMRYTDIWHFFPDMDVRRIQDGEGVFERHLMNVSQLRKQAQLPGFDKDAIRRLLKAKPMQRAPDFMTQLRDINAMTHSAGKECFHVFEYSGPLTSEDLYDIALMKNDRATIAEVEEMDPLDEVNAIVWFCEGEILKIAPYPFDSGETLYSVFNLIKDEASIFGYGIPHIMSHPQKSLNAGWRAMMDNAGKAAGPQVIIARELIQPADGDWTLAPNKVWLANDGIPQDKRAFMIAEIPMYQAELANIVAISKQFIDDMTGMPSVTQGEDGATNPERTAQGTALLMNAANVSIRRIVKMFDDDVTEPNIRRFYDWNMQFSDKEEIKGDYGVDARGSSVLLVREMQATNLMVMALQLGNHPVYGPMLKNKVLLRKLMQAHMISADEILLTDDEIDAVMAQAAAAQAQAEAEAQAKGAGAGTDPAANDFKMAELEVRKDEIAAKIQVANMDADSRRKVAQLQHETTMMKTAEAMNMNQDKLQAMLDKSRAEIESSERKFAAETALTERIGPTGGGNF